MAGLIHDPGAEKRSLMMRRPALCNGQATGRCCAYYWVHVEKVESNNPDNLRLGEVYRGCTFAPSIVHEMTEAQLATVCNQYKPRRLPLWQRPLAALRVLKDPGRYDPSIETYEPLPPEQIRQLQAADEIADVPQVAMVGGVPGATAPMSDEQIATMRAQLAARAGRLTASTAVRALDDNPDADEGIFNRESDA